MDFKSLLEKQLKEKINQKAHDKLSDEAFVIKTMKFFDIYNTGNITYEQFQKACERIGVFYTMEELLPVLETYDPEGRGKIDYIEFSKYLYNSVVPKAHQRKLSPEELRQETAELLDYFRRTLAGRAGNGLISLKRIFHIVDKDGSGNVSIAEFSSIMKEFKIDLSNEQINLIFKIFDINKDGSLSYDEFMGGVRGQMNEFRTFLANKAFDKLDPENQGFAYLQDIIQTYSVTRHPAVVEGRKSEEQVLAEFYDTFEVHHNLTAGSAESRVSRNEFLSYYDNVSATIGDDEYFANVLDATWDISGSASAPTHGSTFTDTSKYGDQLNSEYRYKNLDPKDLKSPTLRSGLESSDNPWGTTTPYYAVATADRRSVASQYKHRQGRDHRQITGEESNDHLFNTKVIDVYNKFLNVNKKPLEKPKAAPTFASKRELELALERFKANIIQRGTRGIIGLKRQFKILDDNNDGTLDINDFQNGLDDYKVEITGKDLETIYYAYNIPGTQSVDYVRLLKDIVGDLSEFRAAKVELAWRKIDKENISFLDWEHISTGFNASRHPGVKAGYITEEEVQHDFAETFKALHSVYHSFQQDQQVTKDEFFEYFRILSTTIPNDKVFDMIMTGVWNIDLKDLDPKTGGVRKDQSDFRNSKSAWQYDFHRSIYGNIDNSPFQHPVEEKSFKPQRPKTAVTKDMPTAGVYSWPFAKRNTFESSVSCLNADNLITKTGATTNDYYHPIPASPYGNNGATNGAAPSNGQQHHTYEYQTPGLAMGASAAAPAYDEYVDYGQAPQYPAAQYYPDQYQAPAPYPRYQ